MNLLGQPFNGKQSCFVHFTRLATRVGNIPCAPDGKVYLCDECATPEGIKTVFEKYQAGHSKHITAFKQVNPGS